MVIEKKRKITDKITFELFEEDRIKHFCDLFAGSFGDSEEPVLGFSRGSYGGGEEGGKKDRKEFRKRIKKKKGKRKKKREKKKKKEKKLT